MKHRIFRTLALMAALTLTVAACATTVTDDTRDTVTEDTLPGGTTPEPNVIRTQGALVQFDACESFLDYVISHGVDIVGPYGFDSGFWGRAVFDEATAATTAAGAEAAEADGGGASFSETNVQVEGVDEPDMVKTDGERIVLMSEGTLIVVDVTGEEPVETGRLRVGDMGVHSLFVSGDKALLFGSVWGEGPIPFAETDIAIAPVQTPTVQIIEVDISGDPEVVRTMSIDGTFVSGRMIDDSVRLVLTSTPIGFDWTYPEGSGLRAEREAVEENRDIVRNSTEDNWIPYYIVSDADGNVTAEGTLFDCERASHPDEFSGLDMLSVVTIDLGNGLDVIDATGVLARGDTIYSSADNLYVATQNWETWIWRQTGREDERPEGPTTDIHKFDVSSPASTEYLASGTVDGYLLNQFAMDEHEGMLRVASTTTPDWWGSGPDSESRITVLGEERGALAPVGTVTGLGKTEQIYSVRFMGDVGYVVTFRQTDPLYTVDLSDPRNPQVIGELKVPGYSAYLHPVGEGLLMGIGQDATEEGMIQGTQVSVFDVSDISDPVRLDTHTLSEGSGSQVEYDHHAFLYWEGLAMVPVQQWWWDERTETESAFMGAVGLRVADDGTLREVATVIHPDGEGKNADWRAQIVRTVVVDDSVYTISAKGIMKSSLDGLDEQAWLDL